MLAGGPCADGDLRNGEGGEKGRRQGGREGGEVGGWGGGGETEEQAGGPGLRAQLRALSPHTRRQLFVLLDSL